MLSATPFAASSENTEYGSIGISGTCAPMGPIWLSDNGGAGCGEAFQSHVWTCCP